MNIEEAEIQAPWGKISLKLWGNVENPAILTVHGVMDNIGSFDGLIPLLPKHYFYICVDLPGHGKSSHFPPHLPIHTSDYILVYTLVMEHFKRDKYTIMAHSYGGQLGQFYAYLYPEKVEKLIMFDTIHFFTIDSKYYRRYMKSRFGEHLKMEKKKETGSAPLYTYEEALDKMLLGRSSPLTETAARNLLKRSLVPKGNEKYVFSMDQRLKYFINPLHDSRYVIETMKENPVKCPTLIVFGLQSDIQRKYLRSILNVLKKKRNVTVIYVPGHHDVHQNSPEIVAPHVEKFLNFQKSKL